MAYYLVKAKAIPEKMVDLKRRLDQGEIFPMRPFGSALDYSLRNARQTPDGWIVWEEEDYCRPPLAMERDAVLDHYFTDLSVELVSKGSGWEQIENLPHLWK
jgi:hypothetical protein